MTIRKRVTNLEKWANSHELSSRALFSLFNDLFDIVRQQEKEIHELKEKLNESDNGRTDS